MVAAGAASVIPSQGLTKSSVETKQRVKRQMETDCETREEHVKFFIYFGQHLGPRKTTFSSCY